MVKAKEVMTKNVISVKKETPICKALELLVEHNISGIPVVEDDMTLIAVISERDILSLYQTSEDVKDKTVDDFMTQPVIFFDEEEGLQDICDCLMNNYIRRVPITSKGKLIGVISRRDIIKKILQTATVGV